jgi:hypothetical protein
MASPSKLSSSYNTNFLEFPGPKPLTTSYKRTRIWGIMKKSTELRRKENTPSIFLALRGAEIHLFQTEPGLLEQVVRKLTETGKIVPTYAVGPDDVETVSDRNRGIDPLSGFKFDDVVSDPNTLSATKLESKSSPFDTASDPSPSSGTDADPLSGSNSSSFTSSSPAGVLLGSPAASGAGTIFEGDMASFSPQPTFSPATAAKVTKKRTKRPRTTRSSAGGWFQS